MKKRIGMCLLYSYFFLYSMNALWGVKKRWLTGDPSAEQRTTSTSSVVDLPVGLKHCPQLAWNQSELQNRDKIQENRILIRPYLQSNFGIGFKYLGKLDLDFISFKRSIFCSWHEISASLRGASSKQQTASIKFFTFLLVIIFFCHTQ